MVAGILSKGIIVVVGILYPAYSSFKAVRRKSHREYTKWMMYWIVFALFQAAESLSDTFLTWLPLYYEIKIIIVLWLVLPITEGSKQLYRVVVHPFLVKHEEQIDEHLTHAGQTGLTVIRRLSQAGLNRAATTVVSSAIRGQAVLAETLLRSQEGVTESTDGTGAAGQTVVREARPSSFASSDDSEPFEVIDEEPESQFQDPLVFDLGSRQERVSSTASASSFNGSVDGNPVYNSSSEYNTKEGVNKKIN